MTIAIAVKARLFARLREQAGTERETVEVPRDATLRDVYAALRRAPPDLAPNLDAVRPALNEEFAGWDAQVADGDEVAFIPPVSGGSGSAGVLFEVSTAPPAPAPP